VPDRADEQLVLLAKRLVRAFFLVYKRTGNYGVGHPALAPPVAELAEVIRQFDLRHEAPHLVLHSDSLFVGDLRVRPDASGFEAFLTAIRLLKRCQVGGVSFSQDAGTADLEAFFVMLRQVDAAPGEDPCAELLHRMADADLAGIEIERPARTGPAPGAGRAGDAKERAKGIYAETLEVISDVMENVKLGKALRLRRAKRVVQTMIDQLLETEATLLGLTNLRCHDAYTYHHSVNVGILSIAIGQRVGLSRNSLVDLGLAAIFHDIGKSYVPLEILNKPTPLDDREWAVMQRHPVFGVRELLKLKGLDVLTARIMQGAFEHHLGLDGSGYPAVEYPQGMSLSGRIIAIADCYDALTSARVYRREADPPDVTLRYILQKRGSVYDPILAKLFVNALGVYPMGTLCQLSSGELAVVMESQLDPEQWERPHVKIIAGADGEPVDGVVVNLAAPGEGRAVARTLDAHRHGIDVSRYFV
jgi:HD-GYP domain-containing protein (c-di-GMP phosphodiesterase class II)